MASDRRSRREFLGYAAAAAGAASLGSLALAAEPPAAPKKLLLSVCAYSYRQYLTAKANPMSMDEFLAKAAELKLDGVEATSDYFQDTSTEALRRFRDRAKQLGLVITGTSVGNDFTHPPGPVRDKQIANTKAWVDHSMVLGAPLIRVFAGTVKKGQTPEDAHKLIVATFAECCDYAGKHGVKLALENHGGPTSTAKGTLQILNDVRSPHLGLNLDTGNFQAADPYADIAACAPHAINVHFKTELRVGGQPQPTDFPRVVRILREAHYAGAVSIEYEAKEDPLTALPRLVPVLREALAAG